MTTDPVREALSASAYEAAYDKAMTGRAVTRTAGPGYPVPWRLDPTRRES